MRVLGPHVGVVGRQVLAADDERIDAEFGRQVIHGELGQQAALWVAGGAHRPGAARVCARDSVFPLPVRDGVEVNVGQCLEVDRRPARGRALGAVAIHVEGCDGTVFRASDLDRAVDARPVARGGDLLLAVEHDLDRRAGLLRQLGGRISLGTRVELAAATATHVVSDALHLSRRNPKMLGQATGGPRGRLSRTPHR